jgi:putative ABC transport system permease protein
MNRVDPLPVRLAARVFEVAMLRLPRPLRRSFDTDIREAFLDDARDAFRDGGTWRLIRVTSSAVADAVFGMRRPVAARRDSQVTSVWQDLRYAVRAFLRQPAFTLSAAGILTLGIGGNTAMFTLVNAAVLRPLPYPEPERLVRVWGARIDLGEFRNNVNPNDAADWLRESPALEALGVSTTTTQPMTGAGDPVMVPVALVSSGFLRTLRVAPAMGRLFVHEHDLPGREREIVITDGFWRRVLGADPNVIGSQVRLSDVACTVIGVLRPDFVSPGIRSAAEPQIWRPLVVSPDNRGGHFTQAIARLKPGASIAEAQAQVDAVAERLSRQFPSTNLGQRASLEPLHAAITRDARTAVLILMAAVAVVLLIACANISSLLLARATVRQREFAVRGALGASRGRIVQQLVTESLLLAGVAGLAGIGLGMLALQALPAWITEELPRVMAVTIDRRVLGFTLVVSVATVLLFAVIPAFAASRYDLRGTLAAGAPGAGAGTRGVQSALIVIEAALALVLLVGATLLIQSLGRLQKVDPGFTTAETLTFRIALPRARYGSVEQRNAFFEQLIGTLRALPGVRDAGGVNMSPLSGRHSCDSFGLADRPAPPAGQEPCAEVRVATPGYFGAMGIPLISGRQLALSDNRGSLPVAVIGESMARRYWPAGDAVGQRLKWGSVASDGPWLTIVGVIGDIKHFALNEPAPDEVYMPLAQRSASVFTIAVNRRGDPSAMRDDIRRVVRAKDPALPVAELFTTDELVSRSVALPRFRTELLSTFAALALLLAMVGIYSLMAFQVAQRRREIGIRLALGASPREVKRLIVARGMKSVGLGCAIGIAAAIPLMRVTSDILFGVTPGQPSAYVIGPALLILSALMASYVPVRRAVAVDPVSTMRVE